MCTRPQQKVRVLLTRPTICYSNCWTKINKIKNKRGTDEYGAGVHASVEAYNMYSNCWTSVAPMSIPRRLPAAAVLAVRPHALVA
jgi:hypothetical protein